MVSNLEILQFIQYVQPARVRFKEYAFDALEEDSAVVEMAGDKRDYEVICDWAEMRLHSYHQVRAY